MRWTLLLLLLVQTILVQQSNEVMTRPHSRHRKQRLSFKSKSKRNEKSTTGTTRSTQSFKVKADLVVNHHGNNSVNDDDDGVVPAIPRLRETRSLDEVKQHEKSKAPKSSLLSRSSAHNSNRTTEIPSSSSSDSSVSPAKTAAAAVSPATAAAQTTIDSTTTTTTPKFIRGGGYSRQLQLSYDERWTLENIDRVIDSWSMTEDQRAKLLDFQQRVRDVDHFLNDPHQLVYFLKDESGNVDLAEKFFRKVVHSRTNSPHDIDDILTSYELPDDYDYFPLGVLKGVDHDGDPIHIERTGVADCWGLFKRHGREAMIRHAIYHQEVDTRGVWVDDYEDLYQKKPCQFTVIFDLQGLSRRHMAPGLLPVFGHVARVLQDTYPEFVKRVIVIRAPSIFKMIWGLIKHFLDAELRDLIVFGTNELNSEEVLEEYIDPNVLPKCIHPGGVDGPLARGFEHVILEGGLIPPEKEYKTPEHIKAKALENAAVAAAAASSRNTQSINHNDREKRAFQTQGKTLLSGSFDLIPLSTSASRDNQCTDEDDDHSISVHMLSQQEYKAHVVIDKNGSGS